MIINKDIIGTLVKKKFSYVIKSSIKFDELITFIGMCE